MEEKEMIEKLIKWLDDAYAMENEIVEVLQSHAKDAGEYPEIKEKIEEHIEVTKKQADRVKKCIEELGGEISEIKLGLAKAMGNLMGAGSHIMEDKLVVNAIAEYTTENMEIATYQAIAMLAELADKDNVVIVCDTTIKEEIEMAEWLQENLPEAVELSLGLKEEE